MKNVRSTQYTSLFGLFLVVALFISGVGVAEAKKYVTYHAGDHNGIWAKISTPSNSNSAGRGQSNWVSTYCCAWMQTGWRYHTGYSRPSQYWEFKTASEVYKLKQIGDQNWGTTVKYSTSFRSGETWCAWVNNKKRKCKGNIRKANDGVISSTEIHDYALAANASVNTKFSYIRIKDSSSGVWKSPSISSVAQQSPYKARILKADSYRVYR